LISTRRLKVLSLALLMSGGTVVLTQQWLQGAVRQAQVEARAKATPTTPVAANRVLVAARPLSAGTILKADQLRWQAWPADAATGAYLTDANTRLDQVAGSVARTGLDAGEPLTAARVVQPGDRGFMAAVLQPGYRAVTVNVSASSGVAGFVLPGDRVDVILSRPLDAGSGAGAKRFVGETVLTDVRVLGMDQRSTGAKDEKKDVIVPQTATLEVTPKGAEVIAVTRQLGELSLSLRSLADTDVAVPQDRHVTRTYDHEATQTAGLRVAASRPATPERRAPAMQVMVIRGSESTGVGAASAQGGTP
jgi:pilus assembly protein CpaB